MKNNKLTIGQMAKLNHTTISTLRLYDKLGLLKPVDVNPENNYRYYDIRQCVIFRSIQFHKSIGLSLKEIETVSKEKDFRYIENLYYRRLNALSRQIDELNAQQRAIIRSLYTIRKLTNLPPVGIVRLEDLDEAYIYSEQTERNYLGEDSGSIELDISHILEQMEKEHFLYEYAFYLGLVIPKKDFLSGTLKSNTLSIYVSRSYAERRRVVERPEGVYACIYFDDFSKIQQYAAKLLQFCEEHQYTIIGDVYCRTIGTINLQRYIHHEEFLCLQVPVQAAGEITPY